MNLGNKKLLFVAFEIDRAIEELEKKSSIVSIKDVKKNVVKEKKKYGWKISKKDFDYVLDLMAIIGRIFWLKRGYVQRI